MNQCCIFYSLFLRHLSFLVSKDFKKFSLIKNLLVSCLPVPKLVESLREWKVPYETLFLVIVWKLS